MHFSPNLLFVTAEPFSWSIRVRTPGIFTFSKEKLANIASSYNFNKLALRIPADINILPRVGLIYSCHEDFVDLHHLSQSAFISLIELFARSATNASGLDLHMTEFSDKYVHSSTSTDTDFRFLSLGLSRKI